ALWEGLKGYGIELEALCINVVDREGHTLHVYRVSTGTVPQPPPQKLLVADIVEGVHLWRSEVPWEVVVERGWVGQEGQPGRRTTPVTFPNDMRDVWGGGDWPASLAGRQAISVPLTHGGLSVLAPEGGYFTGQEVQAVSTCAEAVSLGYIRFFDLKRVEAQHRLVLEEAAIERVQAEVASMTDSQEIFQVVGIVEKSLKELGVRCDDVGIYTIDEETGVVLLYNSDGLIAAGSLKTESLGQLYAHWKEGKTQHQLWTKADVVQLWAEWFNVGHWTEDVLLKGIVERWGDRWIVNVPSPRWTLTMNSRASEPFSQEEIRLLERFAKVVSIGYARFIDFQRVEETQSQLVGELARELRIAHDVQMGILPQTVPQIPGYDIAGVCFPANHVGGDYYEYLWVDEAKTKLAIVVADVSGKGMKAAMAVMRFSEILRYEIYGRQSSDEILAGMNRSVYGRLEQLLYVTVCVGVLDVAGRSLEVSQAGHPPVYHLSSRTGRVMEVGAYDMPVGLVPEVEYPRKAVEIEPGDLLIFYTDGVYEARDRDGGLYGFQRLERVIGSLEPDRSAEEWVDRIVADVERFSGSSQQEDDLTVVVVKVL
ncbi:MAG: PP2C family protein-serine/threonine phosphatase, partial [Candidatus Latescibacteria bacterium]|nr:PP2C family protein-serine/threonine phosphatase [Candidatus Latescibacterota bacterium]